MMHYDFNERYLLNKHEIEVGTEFDKQKFFETIKNELLKEGFNLDRDYYLGAEKIIEGLCLYEEGEFWVVTYFERGTRFSPAFFVDPSDASLFLSAKLKRWPKNFN